MILSTSRWEKAQFKGLAGCGAWRDSQMTAMRLRGRDRDAHIFVMQLQHLGICIVEEAELCQKIAGLSLDVLEAWLDTWTEHDAAAVMYSREEWAEVVLCIVRQHKLFSSFGSSQQLPSISFEAARFQCR